MEAIDALKDLNPEDVDRDPIQVGEFTLVAPPRTTVRQDAYVMKLAQECGLMDVIRHAREGADITDVATTIVRHVWGTGKVPELLAGLLVVKGETWSEERAREVADAIGELTDPQAKSRLTDLVSSSMIFFFAKGAVSSGLSLSSLTDRAAETAPETTSSTSGAPRNAAEDDPAASSSRPAPSS